MRRGSVDSGEWNQTVNELFRVFGIGFGNSLLYKVMSLDATNSSVLKDPVNVFLICLIELSLKEDRSKGTASFTVRSSGGGCRFGADSANVYSNFASTAGHDLHGF